MIWQVRVAGQDVLVVRVTDSFLEWLRPLTTDHVIHAIDPYADATLERPALERWRDELSRIAGEHRARVAADLARTRRVPRDPAVRQTMLERWTDQELSRDEHYRTLVEVQSVVLLALDSDGVVLARGD